MGLRVASKIGYRSRFLQIRSQICDTSNGDGDLDTPISLITNTLIVLQLITLHRIKSDIN